MGWVFTSDVKRLLFAALISGATLMLAQDVTITAQLNGPLSAGSSRKSDLVAAQVGKADHNLDLSKRRAQAVQAVLVSPFRDRY
jgi:hypothetical protein